MSIQNTQELSDVKALSQIPENEHLLASWCPAVRDINIAIVGKVIVEYSRVGFSLWDDFSG